MVAQPQVATQMVYNVPHHVVPQYYHHYPAVQTAYTLPTQHVYSVPQVYNSLPLVHHQQYALTYPYSVMPVVQQVEQKEAEAVEMA